MTFGIIGAQGFTSILSKRAYLKVHTNIIKKNNSISKVSHQFRRNFCSYPCNCSRHSAS